jgi:hypothetical protein
MSNARSDGIGAGSGFTVPGLGSLSKRMLEERGVRSLVDLARTDPYDPRFRILGEPFSAWVLYARAVIADEIVTAVDVTPSAIRVTCQKAHDRQASKNSVMGRLGIYDLYVDVELRERPESYEVVFSLKPEQMKFGMAQWMEYRNNALQLRNALRMKVAAAMSEAPIAVAKWPLEAFEKELEDAVREVDELRLLTKLYYRILSSDRLNAVVLWDRAAINRSLARNFLDEFTPKSAHIICGGNSSSDLQEQIALEGNDGVVLLDDFEKAVPEERRVLLDLMATRRTRVTFDGKRTEVTVKARFIFNLWQPERLDSPLLDPDFLGLVDIAMRMPRATERSAFDQSVGRGLPSAQEAKSAIQSTLAAEVIETGAPDDIRPRLAKYRAPRFMAGYGTRLETALTQLALAAARQRRSPIVERADYDDAFELVTSANTSLVFRQRKA